MLDYSYYLLLDLTYSQHSITYIYRYLKYYNRKSSNSKHSTALLAITSGILGYKISDSSMLFTIVGATLGIWGVKEA
jgi:hypothetical protein